MINRQTATEDRHSVNITAESNKGDVKYPDHNPSMISFDQDDLDLQQLGYKSVLARCWGPFDNFACSFSALNCIGAIRVLFYIALSGGGPAAM
jgi:hypothetical protein